MSTAVALTVNGRAVEVAAEPRTHLADALRDTQHLTGTHLGCEQGVCGACTLFVDGRPVRSCITLAVSCDGADVRTVEGFDDDPLMDALRTAFKQHHALQCGYCTPGMLATAYDIVRRLPAADEARIRVELAGNLCRCTGYAGIVRAILAVLHQGAPPAAVEPMPRDRPRATAAVAITGGGAPPPAAAALRPVTAVDLDGAPSLTRTVTLRAPIDAVWAVLADLTLVADCIPGATLSAPPRDGAFTGHFDVALGPVSARFAGRGVMTTDNAARSGDVVGQATDGFSRTGLDGAIAFRAAPDGETTLIDFTVQYRLKGPLAQFGRPAVVAAIADRLISDTAAALEQRARGEAPITDKASGRPASGWRLLVGVAAGFWRRLLRRG